MKQLLFKLKTATAFFTFDAYQVLVEFLRSFLHRIHHRLLKQ